MDRALTICEIRRLEKVSNDYAAWPWTILRELRQCTIIVSTADDSNVARQQQNLASYVHANLTTLVLLGRRLITSEMIML